MGFTPYSSLVKLMNKLIGRPVCEKQFVVLEDVNSGVLRYCPSVLCTASGNRRIRLAFRCVLVNLTVYITQVWSGC